METPHSKYAHVYALLRYDEPIDATNWRGAASVIKVFKDRGTAEIEMQRMSSVKDASKCSYGAFR